MPPTFRQLRYFLAIAELRSVRRAASVLHVSQPALSRQLHELEQTLGAVLFDRSERGVTLTQAGLSLQQRAAQLVRELEGLPGEIGSLTGEPRGVVRIGLPPSMHEGVTRPLIAAFRERHPQVNLRVTVDISMVLNELVQTDKLDMAVVSDVEPGPALEHEPLVAEPLCLIGRAGALPACHALPAPSADAAACAASTPPAVPLSSLQGLPLLMTPQPNSLRLIVEEAMLRAGVSAGVLIESNSVALIIDLVADGAGFTVLPACAVQHALADGRLASRPVAGLQVAWTLIRPRTRSPSVAAQRLVAMLRERIGEAYPQQAQASLR